MGDAATYEDVILNIAENYKGLESSIANQLLLNVSNHHSTEGSYREAVWQSLFEMIIPRKYCIEQGVFIIDSYGHKSKEVDLAIFDELYTPYIFNYGKIKFIPIEAVAAVVQCKSRELKRKEIEEWVDAIDALIPSLDSVVRMVNKMVDNMEDNPDISNKHLEVTQTATRPVKLLCTLAGKEFIENYKKEFDILLGVDEENKKLIKLIPEEEQSLEAWNDSLNHALDRIEDPVDKLRRENKKRGFETQRQHLLLDMKVPRNDIEEEENVILSLIFQLNQLLMVINNPMLFPHRAYAKRISDILEKSSQSKGEKIEPKAKEKKG